MSNKKLHRVPLYDQLNQILRELIRSDEFSVGDKFLTEREICERFDVSRATASKALSKLIVEGILEIRKGVGTFICNPEESRSIPAGMNISFTNKTLAAGRKPTTELISFSELPGSAVPEGILKKMKARRDEGFAIGKRVRLANNKPMIVETHIFRMRFYPGLKGEDLIGSVYDMHSRKFGITLKSMDETIRPTVIGEPCASYLKVPEGTPGFLMFFCPRNEDEEPLYYAEVVYRGDCFEFHNRMGPIQISPDTLPDLLSI